MPTCWSPQSEPNKPNPKACTGSSSKRCTVGSVVTNGAGPACKFLPSRGESNGLQKKGHAATPQLLFVSISSAPEQQTPLQAGAACRSADKAEPRVPAQSPEPALRPHGPVTTALTEPPHTESSCPPTASPRAASARLSTAFRDGATPPPRGAKRLPAPLPPPSLPKQTPAPQLDERCQHGGADRTKSLRPTAARHGLGLLPAAGSGLTYSVMRLASSVQAAVELAEKTR